MVAYIKLSSRIKIACTSGSYNIVLAMIIQLNNVSNKSDRKQKLTFLFDYMLLTIIVLVVGKESLTLDV